LASGDGDGGPSPGTGDVAFRLTWWSHNDLDLYVMEPSGFVISYSNRNSPTGGQLDIDANAACSDTTDDPIENVFWPVGQAPEGTYTVWIYHWGRCSGPSICDFRLQILRGTRVVQTYDSQVSERAESTRWTYEFTR